MVDEQLYGGFKKGELVTISASDGTGKSMYTREKLDERNAKLHAELKEVADLRAQAWRILAKMYPNGYTSQQVESVPQWQRSVELAEKIFDGRYDWEF